MRPRSVERPDKARRGRIVERVEPEAAAGLSLLLRLRRNRQDVAADVQRVAAHVRRRRIHDTHGGGLGGIRDVEDREAVRAGLVCHVQEPPPAGGELHREAFAAAGHVGMTDQRHVERGGGNLGSRTQRRGSERDEREHHAN